MKMVGLNVAADSFMSAAYIGNIGGLVVISCDDPGPHSSQTEQDSRLMARLGKVPVFDPANPEEAREMIKAAFDLSEEFQVPVMVRPAIRVCHARQNIKYDVLDLIAEGDKVAARVVATGTHMGEYRGIAASGNIATWKGIEIFRIADGKVIEHWGTHDELARYQQMGVLPDIAKY